MDLAPCAVHQAALLASSRSTVFASRIGRSARISPGASVLEADLRLDVDAGLRRSTARPPGAAYFSAMKPRRTLRVRVSSPSSASSSLCRTRKRWICEPRSRRIGRQVGVRLLHARADQIVDRLLPGEVGVAGVGQVSPLRPVAHRRQVDAHERRGEGTAVSEGHRLLDEGEELELVLQVFRREQRPVLEPAHVARPVDDPEMSVVVEEAGVPGAKPSIGGHGLRAWRSRRGSSHGRRRGS